MIFSVTCTLIAALALVPLAEVPAVEPAAKPNILIILADDLGYSDLGCYGGEIKTPNLDALASKGLRFTQFYNSTRCCPSRACLLTGLYPHQAGVGLMTSDRGAKFPGSGDQGEKYPGYRGQLNEHCVTLGQVMQPAGYKTYAVGKWHVGDFDPTTRGFDAFYGFSSGYAINSWDANMMVRLPAGKETKTPETFYATDAITDHALDFMHDARGEKKPFLLYLAYQAPHFPLQAPKDEIDKYVPIYEQGWDKIREQRLARMKQLGLVTQNTTLTPRSLIPHPEASKRHGSMTEDGLNPAWDSLPTNRRADLARRMATYAAMVSHMDTQIGRVISDLREAHELDNTMICFLSDNGACAEWDPFGFDLEAPDSAKTRPGVGVNLGTQAGPSILHEGDSLVQMGGPSTFMSNGSGWANACNTPWRLYKHYTHEGGISTPFIMHWPAGIAAQGEFRAQPSHLIDLMATVAEVGRAKYPTESQGSAILPMEGKSLVRILADKPMERDALYWEHEGNAAVRVGDLKVVRRGRQGPWELYDLKTDRTELNNLAAAQPEKVKELATKWEAWAKRVHVTPYPGGDSKKKDGAGTAKAAAAD